ncbi:unnamed protein product [Caenorhabditis auriculariae]|uniref:BED-type domain-containing protein n=1 Tax=Caenorhabditis auriculariae TaxID=2777116 RepID=A0A8S1GYM6_9PELO|nr:unnamed protein product [Caenorhabditis auriculariae]
MPKVPVNLNAGIPMNSSPCPTPVAEATPPKRKRQRRNPVWPYFDVIDGTARCKQCLYSTKSVFSTNLKVHLRSHHRADYEKVIQAEDALNLNALLLSGNTSKLLNPDSNRKRMPPMTSSILMTINKLANQQQNGEENPLNNVLRQTLAATGLQQHFQQVQSQLQAQQQQQQQQQQHQAQQVQQKQMPQFALNAANLAALNQLARNHIANQQHPISPEQLMNHLNFQNLNKPVDVMSAPHGTDANGVPQPKRRRLRRHPVWMFFRDLEDRMVGCINCEFRTGSAFSTNLKMHLKAHHKEDYERVLQLEEEMRIEEGCLGPANKIKSELIDFIRHGGNASTPSTPTGGPTTPKASPLVQQIISQTMGARVQPGLAKKECSDEDVFSGMSMSDKLAALVGLVPPAGSVEGEIRDVKPIVKEEAPVLPTTFEEMRRAAERFMATSMGLAPPPQQTTIVDLNGSILSSESKSTCSAPSDASEDRKSERDKALARLWADSEELVSNDNFREFVHSLAPDYEIPEIEHLAQLAEQF